MNSEVILYLIAIIPSLIPWFFRISILKKIIFSILILISIAFTMICMFIYSWRNSDPLHHSSCLLYLLKKDKPMATVEIYNMGMEYLSTTSKSGSFCISKSNEFIIIKDNDKIMDTIDLTNLESDTIFIEK